ncbi:MAG TPA: RHS repeat-associated core domain-containing protein [Candidatus Acidoferrales bacterium]|nr:RHS repeat-associated core domain-containing protein [Candidatus Acidoferrales bacterium]
MLTADGTGAYVYDAFGRRIEKTAGSTGLVYLYDLAGREIGEVNTSGANAQGDVYAGSRHLAIYGNNTTSFFHSDQLGTERVRTAGSGTVDDTCMNMPFGDDQSCTSGEPLGRFAGYERDNEYGLAHAPARYYSPAVGRFMTPDPLDGGVPQVSYPDPGLAALSATLSGHVLAPLSLSTTKRAPGPQVQSLDGQVPLGEPGCAGCGCSAASAGGALSNPQFLDRYAYLLNSPSSRIDPRGTVVQFCLDSCLFKEVVCETGCLAVGLSPPPFDLRAVACSAGWLAGARRCEIECQGEAPYLEM